MCHGVNLLGLEVKHGVCELTDLLVTGSNFSFGVVFFPPSEVVVDKVSSRGPLLVGLQFRVDLGCCWG